MKYVRFSVKCIMVAIPIIALVLYTLLCPMAYMDEEYASWRFSKEVSEGKLFANQDFDTIILGDSGAMSSFVPNILSEKGNCINLAVGGGTSIEMYYFLRNYLEYHAAPKNVVIMFAPFHYTNIDNYDTRTRYFKALKIKDAAELYELAELFQENSVYSKNAFWEEFSYRMGLPTKYLPAITASKVFGRYNNNKKKYEDIVAQKGYGLFGTADGCDGFSYECAYEVMDFSNDAGLLSRYYSLIMDMCNRNGINVLVVQEALNQSSYEAIKQGYVDGYKFYLDSIQAQFPDINIEKELRCYPNEYFGDVSHLNEKGSRVFSEEMKQLYPTIFQ